MDEVTRAITLHITLHQNNICPDLDLLLSSSWILNFLKIEIKHLTSNLLDLPKAWTTSTWPTVSQLVVLGLLPSKIMERMLLHSKGYGCLWAAVSERTFRRPLSQICKAIVKPFQQRRPWASLLTLLGKQGICWMNDNPHLWHSAWPVVNFTCAVWTNNTIKCTRWFIIVMADTVGLKGSRARATLSDLS